MIYGPTLALEEIQRLMENVNRDLLMIALLKTEVDAEDMEGIAMLINETLQEHICEPVETGEKA